MAKTSVRKSILNTLARLEPRVPIRQPENVNGVNYVGLSLLFKIRRTLINLCGTGHSTSGSQPQASQPQALYCSPLTHKLVRREIECFERIVTDPLRVDGVEIHAMSGVPENEFIFFPGSMD